MRELNSRLKLVRILLGWSQADLSEKLGITPNYLSLLERGRKGPSYSLLKRFAEVTGVSLGVLVDNHTGADPGNEPLRNELRERLEVLKTLTDPRSTPETEASPRSGGLAGRFKKLASSWRAECAHVSSVREMVLHPAYQQIIGMGPDALPLIFAELERSPDHWFWALRAITQEDPVPREHRGNVVEMARAWLGWAERRGITW